jgi:hypothetical protein
MRPVVLCECEQRDKRYGQDGEGEGARRVLLAPPSLDGLEDGVVVHCHDIFGHARSRAVGV